MSEHVPIIDIGPYLAGDPNGSTDVVEAVRTACEEIGFLVVTGHGIDARLREAMRTTSAEFFDLPVEEKLEAQAVPGESLGYVPFKTEFLAATLGSTTPPDLKESFDIRRPNTPDSPYYSSEMGRYYFRPFVWPARPAGFKDAWTAYYGAMSDLSRSIMQIFAEALGLDRDHFAPLLDKSVDFLRVINYPAQLTPPEPGQLRAGEHTDYGSLTLVSVENVDGGLQVQAKDGAWVDVPAIADSFVLNIGDMMAKWTNDRWVSTLHRVVNPDLASGAGARRQSIVFFQNPNYDTVLQPLPGCGAANDDESVEAGEWLRNKSLIAKNQTGTAGEKSA